MEVEVLLSPTNIIKEGIYYTVLGRKFDTQKQAAKYCMEIDYPIIKEHTIIK